MVTSGIRIGTPAVTTRGMKEPEMEQIGALIARPWKNPDDEAHLLGIKREVRQLTERFPLYLDLL